MPINLELFRVFYTVVKNGSITGAAKELFISQPAVSQSIKQLEAALGGKLFVRNSRGMELTPEGASIFEYVESANNLLNQAEFKFGQLKRLVAGEIRLGASDNICKNYLLQYIKTFHNMYPNIVIQITNRTSRSCLQLLKASKIDIAFINFPCEQDSELEYTEGEEINDCFIAGAKFADFAQKPLKLHELCKMSLIMLEKGTFTRDFLDNFFEANDISIRPELELGSHDLLVEFAKKNMGIACVTEQFVKKELENGEVFKLNIEPQFPSRHVGYVKMKRSVMTFAAQRFLEIIEDKIKS